MNTVPTCLRWNGEHEDVDQGQNQHRQQHGQHQQGRTSSERDLVQDIGGVSATLPSDLLPCPSGQELPFPVDHKRLQIYGRYKRMDVDRLDRISAPDEHLPIAGLPVRENGIYEENNSINHRSKHIKYLKERLIIMTQTHNLQHKF